MTEFYVEFAKDRNAEYTKVQSALDSTIEDVRQKLVAIGYVDDSTLATPGCVRPEYLHTHPAVMAARVYRDDLRNVNGQRSDNDSARQTLEAQLTRVKADAIA
ncbi:MAG: hypothetical protein KDA86_25920 [Planctomycetaceae bacterium]|nr:hypothetical protein [Planctomycetaceae bacterium]